ncbi:MAG: DUF669 domain-containing protein [Planctomycetes bacterium]|nr:DUF669 domain-containing protein [Planctomycetota bacterium]
MATLDFNAHDVEPTAVFDPLPAGKYLAAITLSEMKPTKAGTGSYLQLEFTVLDGACKGRKVWDRLCINHPNDLTQKIARGNLSAICRAVGVMQPRDSVELHNLPLVITVKCKKRDDTGEVTNEVKGYARRESAVGQPQQTPVHDQTPPWAR